MKARLLASLAILALCLSGCDSVSDATSSVRQKFVYRDQPRLHVFAAEQRDVYGAAVKALDRVGFRFVRGGPAQGRLEAVSGLVAGKNLESTQQLTLKATLGVAPAGGTEMQLHLYEVIESDATRGAGQGVSSPMRDTPLYESYFREVQTALDAAKRS